MIEHIEAQRALLNIEINAIDEAVMSITVVKSFADLTDTNIMDGLERVRNSRVQRMRTLDERLEDLARSTERDIADRS